MIPLIRPLLLAAVFAALGLPALAGPLHVVIDTMDLVPLTDTAAVVNSTRSYTVNEVMAQPTQSVTGLRQVDGSPAAGLVLEMTGFYQLGGANTNNGLWNEGRSVGMFTPAMAQDYIWNEGPGGKIVLRGLDPQRTYDLRWLAVRSGESIGSSRTARYVANGRYPDGLAVNQGFNATDAGWNQGQYLQWSRLAPDATGAISIDANGTNPVGSYAYLSALELDESPVSPASSLDTTFNPPVNGSVLAVASQPDGKLLVAGMFSLGRREGIVRLHPDGSLDTSFTAVLNQSVQTLALQPDGRILVAGTFNSVNGQNIQRLARLMPNGSVDASFQPVTTPTSYPAAMLLRPDGKIVLVATMHLPPASTRHELVRLNANGSLDPAFTAPAFSGSIRCAVLQPDGKVVLGGQFETVAGASRRYLARLNENGSVDPGFTGTAPDYPYCMALLPDGRLLVGGYFGRYGTNNLARLSATGVLDATFSPRIVPDIYALSVQADGQILVAGEFESVAGAPALCFTKLTADGVRDPSLTAQVSYGARCIHQTADGSVILGGQFTTVNGVNRPWLARLKNETAVSTARIPNRQQVLWTRTDGAPEIDRARAELSTDGGATWLRLPDMTRQSGGWKSEGFTLPPSGLVRLTGRSYGGERGTSSGEVSATRAFTFPVARLTVLSGDTVLPDGALLDFGSTSTGSRVSRPLTLRNDGDAPLTVTGTQVTGAFSVAAASYPFTIAPGAARTLTLHHATGTPGPLSGELAIASDAEDRATARISLAALVIAPPTATDLPASQQLVRQTGLITRSVRLENPYSTTVPGFRLIVLGVPAGVEVFNAGGKLPDGRWYVDVLQPLAPGATLELALEYYHPARSVNFTPQFTTEVILNPPSLVVPADGAAQVDRVEMLADRSLLIEFTGTPGHPYQVEYSHDGTTWKRSPVLIRPAANRVQWIDRGAPRTDSPPADHARRLYRVRAIDD